MTAKNRKTCNLGRPILIKWGLLGLLTASTLYGCAKPNITLSDPKVYNGDQVATILGNQYRKLNSTISELKVSNIQEAFLVKQGTQLNTNIAAVPAGTTPVTAPDSITSEKLDVIGLSMPAESGLGLSYSASLRKQMSDSWEGINRSLLLAGDQTLKNAKSLILVRFDVSINNYFKPSYFNPINPFIYIRFTLDPLPPDSKIYALEPEYNSSVGKEELITTTLEDYQGEAGGTTSGFNLQGALRYQRALYEGIQKIVEQPLQFSVYSNNSNEFACALGAVRKIVKRSWINPARIFGNKYRIDYVIEPGVRQCYALIVSKNDFPSPLTAKVAYQSGYLDKDAEDAFAEDTLASNNVDGNGGWKPISPSKSGFEFDIPKITNADANVGSGGFVFPKITSTVVVKTSFNLSADTRVLIGPSEIESKDIEILGRQLLKVTIPPNEALKELLKKGKGAEKTELVVISPGCSKPCSDNRPITLKDSGEDKKADTSPKPSEETETVTTTKKFVK